MIKKVTIASLVFFVALLGGCGQKPSKEVAVEQAQSFIQEKVDLESLKFKDYEVKEIGEGSYRIVGTFTIQPNGVVSTVIYSIDATYDESTGEWLFENIQANDMADLNR
ncbi:hypothetical protein [Bacillus phage SP8]|nr:hypothetical protein [Bacillus phage SP8]